MLIVTPFYPPVVSGAGRYGADIAGGMSQRGHRVTVLTGGGTPGTTDHDGVTVERVPGTFRGSTSLRITARAVARHRREPFDLIVSGVAYPMGVVAAALARCLRRPLVVLALGEDVSVGEVSIVARWSLRRVFAQARSVVAISTFTRHEVVRFGADPDRCTTARPGIDPTRFVAVGNTDRQAFRRSVGLDGRRVLLTVARLERRKGHDTVLDAMCSLIGDFPDLHYLVVGEGDPTALRERACRHGLAGRLTILGDLDDTTVPLAFAAADVFVMVSRPGPQTEVEGFGLVYLEASASGLPCVAGNLGGSPDAVVDGVTGFCVDPCDAGAVADALRSLLSAPAMAAEMGERGRRHVMRNHQRSDLQDTVSALLVDTASEAHDRRRSTP
jgi:phosphatidylinositol alpha-1,6-mannosyltransferase